MKENSNLRRKPHSLTLRNCALKVVMEKCTNYSNSKPPLFNHLYPLISHTHFFNLIIPERKEENKTKTYISDLILSFVMKPLKEEHCTKTSLSYVTTIRLVFESTSSPAADPWRRLQGWVPTSNISSVILGFGFMTYYLCGETEAKIQTAKSLSQNLATDIFLLLPSWSALFWINSP